MRHKEQQIFPMTKTKISISVFLLLCASVAVVYITLTRPQRSLGQFMKQVGTVELGRTTLQDWTAQLSKSPTSDWQRECNDQRCVISLQAENFALNRLHLAPRTRVLSDVQFRNGVASKISLWFEIYDMRDNRGIYYPGTGVTIGQSIESQTCNTNYTKSKKQNGGYQWGVVTMDRCIAPASRASALAINTTCLAQIGGCKTIETMLPRVF